ncbi:MAG: purine-binding chemotaxis protein CheW [Dehalococcoidales bacterium]|nr:purine-binding chemotaxis protein CheW [Dehalococcoidales bacterium]
MAKDTLANEKQMVLFELGTETYGLDIASVHEIIRMQPITKVPKAPFYVEGVINLRGRVIPVIDIGKRFGFEKTEEAKNNRIVVINIKDTTLGIIVDAVTEVIRIPAESIDPVSDIVTSGQSDYLQGIAKLPEKMIIILALDKLLMKDAELVDMTAQDEDVKQEPASIK